MKNSINVEEDGDEIFTLMPTHCQKWECRDKDNTLENKKDFMCCPNCGASYGATNPQPE